MFTGPEYKFNGRTYKTVAGLSKALFADSGCDSHSMVDTSRHITCTRGRGACGCIVDAAADCCNQEEVQS